MSDEKAVNKEDKFVSSLTKDKVVTEAYQKLNRKALKVSVYANSSVVQKLESELDFVEQEIKLAKSKELIEKLKATKTAVEERLKAEEGNKIEGYLTTLSYRDLGDIKAAITEAVLHFREYKFDDNVVMARIIAEERFMTIFCALKNANKHNPAEPGSRYYDSLDAIAMADDVTILDLYDKWERHFCLSDDEIKN